MMPSVLCRNLTRLYILEQVITALSREHGSYTVRFDKTLSVALSFWYESYQRWSRDPSSFKHAFERPI
jgi:hypothetical protein